MLTILVVLAVFPWYAKAEFNYYHYPRPGIPFGQSNGFALPTYQINPNFQPQMSFQMPYMHLHQMRQPVIQNIQREVTYQQNYNHNGVSSANYDSGAWRPIPNAGSAAQQTVGHSGGSFISSQFGGPVTSPSHLQSGAAVQSTAAVQSATAVQSSASAQSTATAPIITKNIYFHIPPPDIEQLRPPVAQSPPKKIYKIVFIKVPSQESTKQVNAMRAQQAAVEEKTLIYVLYKKPEPQKVSEPSKPEVFFVKYKGEANKVMTQISGSLPSVPPPSPTPTMSLLKPGLVNGRQ